MNSYMPWRGEPWPAARAARPPRRPSTSSSTRRPSLPRSLSRRPALCPSLPPPHYCAAPTHADVRPPPHIHTQAPDAGPRPWRRLRRRRPSSVPADAAAGRIETARAASGPAIRPHRAGRKRPLLFPARPARPGNRPVPPDAGCPGSFDSEPPDDSEG